MLIKDARHLSRLTRQEFSTVLQEMQEETFSTMTKNKKMMKKKNDSGIKKFD